MPKARKARKKRVVKKAVKISKEMKREKHSVAGMIGLSFQRLFKNGNAVIMLPFIFNFIATMIILVIVLLISGLGLGAIFGASTLDTLGMDAAVLPDISMAAIPSIIITLTIGLLAIWFINCYFSSGAIGMAFDISRKRKTGLGRMHNDGKRFLFRYWLASLLILVALTVWLLIFSLPAILASEPTLFAIAVLSLIPAIFVFILFTFAYTLLIVYNLGAWEAITRSVRFVKNNYWAVFGLLILYILMIGVINFIPIIGSLANLVIITPAMTIAFVLFVLQRSKAMQ